MGPGARPARPKAWPGTGQPGWWLRCSGASPDPVAQLAPVTIKSIAAEAAPTDTPSFLPMRSYRRPTIPADAHLLTLHVPADTHDPVGAALAAIEPEPAAKAARSPHQAAAQLPSMTIIRASRLKPLPQMRSAPADAHGNRGRGFSRDRHQSLAKAASMASLRVRRTLTRAKRLSLASISVQGAISVLVRSTMSPTASA